MLKGRVQHTEIQEFTYWKDRHKIKGLHVGITGIINRSTEVCIQEGLLQQVEIQGFTWQKN